MVQKADFPHFYQYYLSTNLAQNELFQDMISFPVTQFMS